MENDLAIYKDSRKIMKIYSICLILKKIRTGYSPMRNSYLFYESFVNLLSI